MPKPAPSPPAPLPQTSPMNPSWIDVELCRTAPFSGAHKACLRARGATREVLAPSICSNSGFYCRRRARPQTNLGLPSLQIFARTTCYPIRIAAKDVGGEGPGVRGQPWAWRSPVTGWIYHQARTASGKTMPVPRKAKFWRMPVIGRTTMQLPVFVRQRRAGTFV